MTDARSHVYAARLSTFAKVAALALVATAALVFAAPAGAQAPVATFTLETSTADGQSVTPRLTWTTAPAATSCEGSGDWSGVKLAAGTEVLAPVTSSKSYTLTCLWPGDMRATVTWGAPTTNTDGTPYTDPGGYRVLYGRSVDNLDQSAYLNDQAARSWEMPASEAGHWWFTVRAVNARGLESANAMPIVTKTLTASASQARTLNLGITFPSSPTNVGVQ